MANHKVGIRLRCERCGAECVVTKPADSDLSCCGQSLDSLVEPGQAKKNEGGAE